MEQVRQSVMPEVMLDIFKRTMPFQVVSDAMLRKIAALGWRASYDQGAGIYDAGDKADDIYIIVSGKVEHALEPGVNARRPVKSLGPGDVFGWAALLEDQPKRIAKAACIEPSTLLRLNGAEVLRVLAEEPASGYGVMRQLASLITKHLGSKGEK